MRADFEEASSGVIIIYRYADARGRSHPKDHGRAYWPARQPAREIWHRGRHKNAGRGDDRRLV